jgi:hypothetical protein
MSDMFFSLIGCAKDSHLQNSDSSVWGGCIGQRKVYNLDEKLGGGRTTVVDYVHYNLAYRSRVSSGSMVYDYGLDDRAIGVRSPAGVKDFSSILCVQSGSGAHPASCPVGTGGPFHGGKAQPGRDADHRPPSRAEVVNE